MNSDDIKRLFLGPTLFRLDTIISPRLIPILYVIGLGGLLIWAVDHLFFSFGSNFGNGIWGLLEIIVYGLLGLVVLRIVCEALLVFFKAHEGATQSVSRARVGTTLLEEVKDAIHDLAEAEEETVVVTEPVYRAPPPVAPTAAKPTVAKRATAVRRTAKRTPKPKT